jgi:hypothetical protein
MGLLDRVHVVGKGDSLTPLHDKRGETTLLITDEGRHSRIFPEHEAPLGGQGPEAYD